MFYQNCPEPLVVSRREIKLDDLGVFDGDFTAQADLKIIRRVFFCKLEKIFSVIFGQVPADNHQFGPADKI